MTEPLLSIRGIEKRFGGLVALAGVSMDVPAGLVYGLIGPNGSGKTTLFNIVSGFMRQDAGTVTFDGRDIGRASPHKVARLGLCRTFQATACPTRMTVMENMLLAPQDQLGEGFVNLITRPHRVRSQEKAYRERARELLAIVNLAGKADEYAGSLSGGQKKLLALAQILMADPKLILLDEPVAGVNPVLAEEIAGVIRRLSGEGRNFLIVEHNMHFIRSTCDRISVLDAGRVIAEGEPADVLGREDVLRAYLAGPATRPAA
ncbi:MAG: ABC transporter ATP-binding protein [Bauldia sp.]|nr:ABC transporter ATP-binding protein [Bauldia sp.]